MISKLLSTNLSDGLVARYFKITYADLTDTAGTSKTLSLFTLPANALVIATKAKHGVAFAGAGITDMSFVVGKSGVTNWLVADLDIDAAVADGTQNVAGIPTSNLGSAAVGIIATVGSTGANLTELTAGEVEVWIAYLHFTTPADA